MLSILTVGLEAGPNCFRAFKQHGRSFIINILVLLGVAGVTTVAIISLAGVPVASAWGFSLEHSARARRW